MERGVWMWGDGMGRRGWWLFKGRHRVKWSTLPTGKLALSVAWWMHHCIYVIMEKREIVWSCFLSLCCPCLGIFPGNKGCERISNAKKGWGAKLTGRILQRVRQQWGYNSSDSFLCSRWLNRNRFNWSFNSVTWWQLCHFMSKLCTAADSDKTNI